MTQFSMVGLELYSQLIPPPNPQVPVARFPVMMQLLMVGLASSQRIPPPNPQVPEQVLPLMMQYSMVGSASSQKIPPPSAQVPVAEPLMTEKPERTDRDVSSE